MLRDSLYSPAPPGRAQPGLSTIMLLETCVLKCREESSTTCRVRLGDLSDPASKVVGNLETSSQPLPSEHARLQVPT